MDEAMQRKCDQLVKMLTKRSQGVHFSRPVEWKKMGLLDYPKLIKEPMDLGTVMERIAKPNFYTRLEHFVDDVRLVWVRAGEMSLRACVPTTILLHTPFEREAARGGCCVRRHRRRCHPPPLPAP
jgi:hypothetical protein